MKRNFLQIIIFLIILTITSFYINCRNENTDADEEFKNQAILNYILLPKYQPIESCKSAYVEAEVCLTESQSFPLGSPNETSLSTVFSLGAANNYTDLCNQSRTSASFNRFSDQAFACNFNCQSAYWRNLASSNLTACSERTYLELWNASISDSGLTKCIQSCFQITGSSVASTQRLELYLLYSTLE